MFFEFNDWLINPVYNKNFLFGAPKLTRDVRKRKLIFYVYEIPFNVADSSSFGNKLARDAVLFGVDKSSSGDSENCENIR